MWTPIRKATDEDSEKIEAAAERFAKRHNIDINEEMTATDNVTYHVETDKRLASLWRGCIRRATGEKTADGIAYGYVGYHA